MNYPLVSICIPTYNRAAILRNSLETLLCQPEFLSKKVEIVISDNASTDNTKEVCESLVSEYENFKYFRNEENIQDRNFPLALSRGTGILRKLFNDYYHYEKDALSYICEAAEKYYDEKPILYFSNSAGSNLFLENIGIKEFLKNVSFFITAIGTFSCWDVDCEDINEKDISYCERNLWQVKKTLSFFEKKDSKAVILNKRIIICNQIIPKKNVTYGLFSVFHDNYLSILYEYVNNGLLDKSTYDWLEEDLLMSHFMQWVIAFKFLKNYYIFSKDENLKKSIRQAYKNKPYYPEFKNKCRKTIQELKGNHTISQEGFLFVKKSIKNIIKKVIFYDKIKRFLPWKNKF